MKRRKQVLNKRLVRVGRRLARWASSGMHWADCEYRDVLMSYGKKVAASHGLCQALGQSYLYHERYRDPVSDDPLFANQSGVSALIYALFGEHEWRLYMIENSD